MPNDLQNRIPLLQALGVAPIADMLWHCSKVIGAQRRATALGVLIPGNLQLIRAPWPLRLTKSFNNADNRPYLSVKKGAWISEAVLWTEWMHVGTLEVASWCQLMLVLREGVVAALAGDPVLRLIACEYARKFHGALTSSQAAGDCAPSGLGVPGTEFEDVMCTMSPDARLLALGLVLISLQ